MTSEQLLVILQDIEKDIPKVKAFLAGSAANPLVTTLITKLCPSVAVVLPVLQEAEPYLDFLLAWDQRIEAALTS